MAIFGRRYKDYKLVQEKNEKGKTVLIMDYIGNYFYYRNPEAAEKAKKPVLFCSIAVTVCWFTALLLRISALRLPYIAIPYVFASIALIMIWRGTYHICFKKEPFIRTAADSISMKQMIGSIFAMIVIGASFVGTLVAVIIGDTVKVSSADPGAFPVEVNGITTFCAKVTLDLMNVIFLIICMIFIGCSYTLYKLRKDVDMLEKFTDRPDDEGFERAKMSSMAEKAGIKTKDIDVESAKAAAKTAKEAEEETEKDLSSGDEKYKLEEKIKKDIQKEAEEKAEVKDAAIKQLD